MVGSKEKYKFDLGVKGFKYMSGYLSHIALTPDVVSILLV